MRVSQRLINGSDMLSDSAVFIVYYLLNTKLLTAIAIAISDSVTVSMGDDTNGARNEMAFVSGDVRSTSSAVKSM